MKGVSEMNEGQIEGLIADSEEAIAAIKYQLYFEEEKEVVADYKRQIKNEEDKMEVYKLELERRVYNPPPFMDEKVEKDKPVNIKVQGSTHQITQPVESPVGIPGDKSRVPITSLFDAQNEEEEKSRRAFFQKQQDEADIARQKTEADFQLRLKEAQKHAFLNVRTGAQAMIPQPGDQPPPPFQPTTPQPEVKPMAPQPEVKPMAPWWEVAIKIPEETLVDDEPDEKEAPENLDSLIIKEPNLKIFKDAGKVPVANILQYFPKKYTDELAMRWELMINKLNSKTASDLEKAIATKKLVNLSRPYTIGTNTDDERVKAMIDPRNIGVQGKEGRLAVGVYEDPYSKEELRLASKKLLTQKKGELKEDYLFRLIRTLPSIKEEFLKLSKENATAINTILKS